MTRLWNVTHDWKISKETSKRIIRTVMFLVFLHAAETWLLKAADKRRIVAFEKWVWRGMSKDIWTAQRQISQF